MRITLVLTDSSIECRKALEWLARYEDLFSAQVDVFVVLEDIYKLESASVSLGVPIPPDTVRNAKERAKERVRSLWRHLKGDEEVGIDIETVAGRVREEVLRLVKERRPDMILWGCQPTPDLCKVMEEIDIPFLIIK